MLIQDTYRCVVDFSTMSMNTIKKGTKPILHYLKDVSLSSYLEFFEATLTSTTYRNRFGNVGLFDVGITYKRRHVSRSIYVV